MSGVTTTCTLLLDRQYIATGDPEEPLRTVHELRTLDGKLILRRDDATGETEVGLFGRELFKAVGSKL